MRKLFTESQLNKLVEMMSYTQAQINQFIESIVGDIALQGKISNYKLFLFAPKMRVVQKKAYIDAPNVSISGHTLTII